MTKTALRLTNPGVEMGKHDQTRDGGRPYEQVDPSKIVKPKEEDGGKHGGSGGRGGNGGSTDDKKK